MDFDFISKLYYLDKFLNYKIYIKYLISPNGSIWFNYIVLDENKRILLRDAVLKSINTNHLNKIEEIKIEIDKIIKK